VVNADAEAGPVNILADDASTFTAVKFKGVTSYQPVTDNFITFKAHPAATTADSATAQNREMLDDGDRYVLVVVPGKKAGDKPSLKVLEESTDHGDSPKARIRFVNAARGLDEFSVYLPGREDAFVNNVGFGSEAGFKDLDPQNGSLQIRSSNGPQVLLDMPSRSWEAGRSYTVVVTNKSALGKRQASLDAIVVQDEGNPVTASSR
jgi:hypothetical protein